MSTTQGQLPRHCFLVKGWPQGGAASTPSHMVVVAHSQHDAETMALKAPPEDWIHPPMYSAYAVRTDSLPDPKEPEQ